MTRLRHFTPSPLLVLFFQTGKNRYEPNSHALKSSIIRYLAHADFSTQNLHAEYISGILLKLRISGNHTSGIRRSQGPSVHTLHYAYCMFVKTKQRTVTHMRPFFSLQIIIIILVYIVRTYFCPRAKAETSQKILSFFGWI